MREWEREETGDGGEGGKRLFGDEGMGEGGDWR